MRVFRDGGARRTRGRWMGRMAMLAMLATSAGAALAQPAEPPAVRLTQPLMKGWQFVQDDALSELAALTGGGQGWRQVDLPHTWNARTQRA